MAAIGASAVWVCAPAYAVPCLGVDSINQSIAETQVAANQAASGAVSFDHVALYLRDVAARERDGGADVSATDKESKAERFERDALSLRRQYAGLAQRLNALMGARAAAQKACR
jgi:hypothetical protein